MYTTERKRSLLQALVREFGPDVVKMAQDVLNQQLPPDSKAIKMAP